MVAGVSEAMLAEKFALCWPHLNERQRRLVVAAEASALGPGGVSLAARASGLSRPTVTKGLQELEEAPLAGDRVRRAGAGRKRTVELDPEVLAALDALVDPDSRGDPESPLRWTCKSTRQLAEALNAQGHAVSHVLVAALLHELDFSLQANAKTIEGKQHPERDAQFRYINEQVRRYLRRGDPVISVDTKKKELVGPYKNGGREWQPVGQPERVKTHDFIDQELGKAIPYGVYDLRRNQGFVSVGTDHDTAAFAVHAVRTWWTSDGALAYPTTRRLLICADAGGSNGYRVRLWKIELARLAAEAGLAITVCHFPPGTSKWNKIEHRLFAAISTNWRGKPLTSHAVIVSLIGATTSRTGLSVRAELDPRRYPKGLKVSDQEMAALHLEPHSFHGDWNYTLRPGPPIRNTPKAV
jgi:Rhodopirellula transposase DDE domain